MGTAHARCVRRHRLGMMMMLMMMMLCAHGMLGAVLQDGRQGPDGRRLLTLP
jgi:hypothetical protein